MMSFTMMGLSLISLSGGLKLLSSFEANIQEIPYAEHALLLPFHFHSAHQPRALNRNYN